MPGAWTSCKLEDLATLTIGGDWGKAFEYVDENYVTARCIRASELRGWTQNKGASAALRRIKKDSLIKRKLQIGDILVEVSGGGPEQPVGRTALIDETVLSTNPEEPKICTNFFRLFRPEPNINSAYLQLYLVCFYQSGQINAYQAGSNNLRNLKFANYLTIEVPLPPIAEQRRIVAKIEALFSELDKGIESLETAREQLKVYRQAVLKQAFEGKLTAQWRVENPEAVLSAEDLLSRLRAQRKQSHDDATLAWKRNFEDWQSKNSGQSKPKKPAKPIAIDPVENGEFPVFPKDWLVLRFGALCASIRNGISKKPEGAAGSKILRISAVRPMECALDDIRLIDNEDGIFGDYFLNAGDLLFTRYNGSRAYVGVSALYRGNGDHLFPDKLIQARLAVPIIRPDYLEMAVNCSISREHIEKRIRTTAGQSGVSGSDIKSIPVPVCSPAEQDLIVEKVQSVWQESGRLLVEINHAIQQSEALRQSILKKAFSGQLVPQDPNDEPASALLARIKAEKAARAKPDKRSRKTAA
nr:restriction endonuclease subunit S [Halochromatium roseum]